MATGKVFGDNMGGQKVKPLATPAEQQAAKAGYEADYPGTASYNAALAAANLSPEQGPFHERWGGHSVGPGTKTRKRSRYSQQGGGTKDTA